MCKCQLALLVCNYAVSLKREAGRRAESPPSPGKGRQAPTSQPRENCGSGSRKIKCWSLLGISKQMGQFTPWLGPGKGWSRHPCPLIHLTRMPQAFCQPNRGAHRQQLRASARPRGHRRKGLRDNVELGEGPVDQ